jgi:type II secretory pathway predicted ATPase ExeA
LWIDETQLISEDTLHEIRLLAEADLEGPPLFSVVLAALPELKERLLAPALFPLWRRITVQVTLAGLRREEVEPFLDHVLAERERRAFTPEALTVLFEQARGIPALLAQQTRQCLLRRPDPKNPITAEQVSSLLDSTEAS